MNHWEPFHWVMGFSVVGMAFSVAEMNEALRFVILLGTSIGVLVKTWEQISKSENFKRHMKIAWTTVSTWKKNLKQK
jgi:hypothetical protein